MISTLLIVNWEMPEFPLFSLKDHLLDCVPWWRFGQDFKVSLTAGSPSLENLCVIIRADHRFCEYSQRDPTIQVYRTRETILRFLLPPKLGSFLKESNLLH